MIDNVEMKYSVGALLYSPALNNKIGRTILGGTLGDKYSLALCLEDTIAPDMVETAGKQAGETLRQLFEARQERDVYLPKLFIRVREPEQMQRVWKRIRPYREIFTGFIFPKYTVSNAAAYNQEMIRINEMSDRKIYMMPILESRDIVDFRTRMGILGKIRDQVDAMEDQVRNVRGGGNDFSNEFAARRH